LGVSRAAVSRVMTAYTNYGKTSSAVRNSGWKSKVSEMDHHTLKSIVSKNNRTTAANVTTELSTLLEDSISTKTVRKRASQIQQLQQSCNCYTSD
jgi:transposase